MGVKMSGYVVLGHQNFQDIHSLRGQNCFTPWKTNFHSFSGRFERRVFMVFWLCVHVDWFFSESQSLTTSSSFYSVGLYSRLGFYKGTQCRKGGGKIKMQKVR